MTTPEELQTLIEYYERVLEKAEEDVLYYSQRLDYATRFRDGWRMQLYDDYYRRLAELSKLNAKETQ